MTIGILAADVATEAMRLGLCSSMPEAERPSICREQMGTVAGIAAKLRLLMTVWQGAERDHVDPSPAQSQEGTQMQQPVNAPES